MKGVYLSHLSHDDPLYHYIREQIAPQLGFSSPGTDYRVFRFTCSQSVYLYEERYNNVRIVVKFHGNHLPDPSKTGEKEYSDLLYIRSLGFSATPHYVVRPLGHNPGIGNALVEEFLEGELLSSIINKPSRFLNTKEKAAGTFKSCIVWILIVARSRRDNSRGDRVHFCPDRSVTLSRSDISFVPYSSPSSV